MISHRTSCLYYPFSRCMNPSSLKQMLLVFDEVNFLDPVDDENWRAKLFDDMAAKVDLKFREFNRLKDQFPILIDEKAVVRLDPDKLNYRINSHEVVAATISDLTDSSWTKTASNPAAYDLPFLPNDTGEATWQMFRPKIPDFFLDVAADSESISKHIYEKGGADYSWSLSYAAGSALSINGHLAVAEELGLAPLTDSVLHQKLLEKKARRNAKNNREAKDEFGKREATLITTDILTSLLPANKLSSLSFEDILRFRSETTHLRKELLPEILAEIRRKGYDDASQNYKKNLRRYQSELAATRDRLWPNLIPSGKELAIIGSSTTVGVVLASLIGDPGAVLLSSILPTALSCAKQFLGYKADKNKIENSASPGIAYLSKIQQQLS